MMSRTTSAGSVLQGLGCGRRWEDTAVLPRVLSTRRLRCRFARSLTGSSTACNLHASDEVPGRMICASSQPAICAEAFPSHSGPPTPIVTPVSHGRCFLEQGCSRGNASWPAVHYFHAQLSRGHTCRLTPRRGRPSLAPWLPSTPAAGDVRAVRPTEDAAALGWSCCRAAPASAKQHWLILTDIIQQLPQFMYDSA